MTLYLSVALLYASMNIMISLIQFLTKCLPVQKTDVLHQRN